MARSCRTPLLCEWVNENNDIHTQHNLYLHDASIWTFIHDCGPDVHWAILGPWKPLYFPCNCNGLDTTSPMWWWGCLPRASSTRMQIRWLRLLRPTPVGAGTSPQHFILWTQDGPYKNKMVILSRSQESNCFFEGPKANLSNQFQ